MERWSDSPKATQLWQEGLTHFWQKWVKDKAGTVRTLSPLFFVLLQGSWGAPGVQAEPAWSHLSTYLI